MTKPKIAAVIPTIPPRGSSGNHYLQRAIDSIAVQTLTPIQVSVALDIDREGAAITRQRALDGVDPGADWVAFLDDDDRLMPPPRNTHLQDLWEFAQDTGADYVYSWYELVDQNDHPWGDRDPIFPAGHYLDPWDRDNPRQTTITTLVRRELAQAVGFVKPEEGKEIAGQRWGEDWDFTLGCNQLGKIEHLVKRTWFWHHHLNNTSGRPDRW